MSTASIAQERQITFSPQNHNLDNNDNFSPDQRFLCYDTRETIGPGINNSLSIEKVEIATGIESIIYKPEKVLTGEDCAPGVGAASYHPIQNKVVFIHGPLVDEVPLRGYYGKPNRKGAEVDADGSQRLVWLDCRDVDTTRNTPPGAHRGGTHRHEYTMDGKRVGFTYDDFFLTEYGRTIGYMEPRADAPGGATHYFCLLVKPAPTGKSKPGEIEIASGDSWIGRHGYMRAFIGKVRAANGVDYEESLFVVDVPAAIDITTAKAGSKSEYPTPPAGLRIRRLTQTNASGVARGTLEGDRIAYYANDANGTKQIFIIASDGSDQDTDPAKRPMQATHCPDGVSGGVRWHPSGNSIAYHTNGAVAVTCVKPGPRFGETKLLTPEDPDNPRADLVWSPDGSLFAYSRAVPSFDSDGKPVKTYAGKDCAQIFVLPFPDADGDGVCD
ncbi:MAG: DUF3748 domain-containing protein [Candidatus Hydrogenedentes bacterium]|nr:DUF3748 domain-containing protein [Candidatus Hydrogenedentota bacterium]